MTLRLRFWLAAMDVTCAIFGFGSAPYLRAVERAGRETYRGSAPLDDAAGEGPW